MVIGNSHYLLNRLLDFVPHQPSKTQKKYCDECLDKKQKAYQKKMREKKKKPRLSCDWWNGINGCPDLSECKNCVQKSYCKGYKVIKRLEKD